MLRAEHITVRYGGLTAARDVSFSLSPGDWLMLAGPNGAGKSTLVNALAQSVKYTGDFWLEGRNVREYKPAALARKIGVLSQRNAMEYAYTVEEVVRLGRYAYRGGFLNGRDDAGGELVEKALKMTGMEEMRHACMLNLSGGEIQRAFLAQVFAQDPQVLILDEPVNHLDLKYQQHIFALIRDWLSQPGRAVLSVVHDLSLAKRFGTRALLLDRGRCYAQGPVNEVLTPENLRSVYGMDVYGWMRENLAQWQ